MTEVHGPALEFEQLGGGGRLVVLVGIEAVHDSTKVAIYNYKS